MKRCFLAEVTRIEGNIPSLLLRNDDRDPENV